MNSLLPTVPSTLPRSTSSNMNTRTQTDVREDCSSQSQTDAHEESTSVTQTDIHEESTSVTQTEVREDCTSVTQTEETIQSRDQHVTLQHCLDDLLTQLEAYSSDITYSESADIRSHYEKLSSCVLDSELVDLKASVDSALTSLDNSRSEILASKGTVLQEAVSKRDTTLGLISETINSYLDKAEDAKLANLVETVNSVQSALKGASKTVSTESSIEEQLLELDEIESGQKTRLGELRVRCSDTLQLIAEDFYLSSGLIQYHSKSGEEGEELHRLNADLKPDFTKEKEMFAKIGKCHVLRALI